MSFRWLYISSRTKTISKVKRWVNTQPPINKARHADLTLLTGRTGGGGGVAGLQNTESLAGMWESLAVNRKRDCDQTNRTMSEKDRGRGVSGGK
jgi:hypothetical protein